MQIKISKITENPSQLPPLKSAKQFTDFSIELLAAWSPIKGNTMKHLEKIYDEGLYNPFTIPFNVVPSFIINREGS